MEIEMSKALESLGIEDDDPIEIPDLPEYSSVSENRFSIIGRLLNPDEQNVSKAVRDMPRKWQLYDRVRGVALSKDKFQFFFRHEYDMEMVLAKGAQNFNEWSVIVERWVEHSSSDYLQFIPIWLQVKEIPVNHYRPAAIRVIADKIDLVQEVEWDVSKDRFNTYVRVKILFNTANPLRRSKEVRLKDGSLHTVFFEYEKIQRRCYHCQRLTHSQERCPWRNPQPKPSQSDTSKAESSQAQQVKLSATDTLFGVLSDEQLGIDHVSGRPKIAPEVLENMRHYLMMEENGDRSIRIARIHKSLEEVNKSPEAQKFSLSLDPVPIVSSQLNKGKGIVFYYEKKEKASLKGQGVRNEDKLLGTAIKVGHGLQDHSPVPSFLMEFQMGLQVEEVIRRSTVLPTAPMAVGLTGSLERNLKKKTVRKRPPKSKRNAQKNQQMTLEEEASIIGEDSSKKRMPNEENKQQKVAAKRQCGNAGSQMSLQKD